MLCCPFHADHTPSLKLYEDHYHCFGCQAHGDVVDLTAAILGLSMKDAALRLAADFHIPLPKKRAKKKPYAPHKPDLAALSSKYTAILEKDAEKKRKDFLLYANGVLSRRRQQLMERYCEYAPKTEDEDWNPLFAEVCHKLEWVEYLFSRMDDPRERNQLGPEFEEEVKRIDERMEQPEFP